MSTTGNSVEFGDVNVGAAHQMGGSSPTAVKSPKNVVVPSVIIVIY